MMVCEHDEKTNTIFADSLWLKLEFRTIVHARMLRESY